MLHISPKKERVLIKTESEESREKSISKKLIDHTTDSFSTMSENTRRDHCEVGESSKLTGIQNYNVWCFKMESILRRERLWLLVESK
jgi:hypothetical protein